jgi:hypothetical protein
VVPFSSVGRRWPSTVTTTSAFSVVSGWCC